MSMRCVYHDVVCLESLAHCGDLLFTLLSIYRIAARVRQDRTALRVSYNKSRRSFQRTLCSKSHPQMQIAQQLKTLSLQQLLEVRKRVDALINQELSSQNQLKGSYFAITLIRSSEDANYRPIELDRQKQSLENVINVVDQWMKDESGYDEETYPQIEAALKQNRSV